MDQRALTALLASCMFVIGISVGVLIGWFSGPDRVDSSTEPARNEEDPDISRKLIDYIQSDTIDEYLRFLSSDPHVAGRPRQYELAEWVRDKFLEYGFDDASISNYTVLLSYPSEKPGEESVIQRLVPNATHPGGYQVEFQSQIEEPPLDETGEGKSVLPPFNAYSATGIVEGELVYANYARVEDFFHLERERKINVTGKIVLARYGKIFRGTKGKFAAQFGAKGLILYSDPADYALPGEPVYPDGIYLPPTGTQRGSCLDTYGDPLTPGYPAIESAYRYAEDRIQGLPTIPIHPIPSKDAEVLLKLLAGDEVTETSWEGDLDLTYKYGPGFETPNEDNLVRMKIFTHTEMAETWNVVGTIRGSVEPDRYVMIGNHRDAWAFGAIDPSSGTASMMEVARAYGELLNSGWRPRRTILFGSWGAEEYGLIGSNEWVEEFAKNLDHRMIAYLNVDVAVSGTFVPNLAATPNLYQLTWKASKLVPDPNPEEFEPGQVDTLYDRWLLRRPLPNGNPFVGDLGSGSDFTTFLQAIGITALDFTFIQDRATIPISPYPMYHSVYETYELVKNFYDPDFLYHQSASRILAEMLRDLAESTILPLSCLDYAYKIKTFFEELRDGETGQQMVNDGGLSFEFMERSVENLIAAADKFENYIETELDKSNPYAVRRINDQLMNFERTFIDALGLPDRPNTRHVIFAPSSRDFYSSDKFAGIVDTMFDIENNDDPNKWEYVKDELAAVTYALNSAAYSLEII